MARAARVRHEDAVALSNLSDLAMRRRDYACAAALIEEPLVLCFEVNSKWRSGFALCNSPTASVRGMDAELYGETVAKLKRALGRRFFDAVCAEKRTMSVCRRAAVVLGPMRA
jgi:hypothetical protein